MKIYWPVDSSIRKAIVFFTKFHSHPMHPTHKMTPTTQSEYVQLVCEVGVTGATVVKVDKGVAPLFM